MPIINGKYYMNPRHGEMLERARQDTQDTEAKRGGILGTLADILDGRIGSSGKHAIWPTSGNDDSGPGSARDNPYTTPHKPEVVPISESNAQAASPQNQRQQAHAQHDITNGHWVTIDHRPVFIEESSDGHSQPTVQRNKQKRKEIADIAREYNHSTAWAFDKKKGDFPAGSNKCNKFVYDVAKEAGAKATVIGKDGNARPPLAGEWADPHTRIANWRVLQPGETPQPGDVAAWPFHYSDATGHSGIVTSVDRNGHVTAIAAHQDVAGPDDSFNPSRAHPKVTYRRFTGE